VRKKVRIVAITFFIFHSVAETSFHILIYTRKYF